mmetsp:Transcript_22326/g.52596  ORF Transcript_22326/g.52596 Transcript_22326/m.52596 type:complete len:550 (+) Transcript_22326:2203-3852(+)
MVSQLAQIQTLSEDNICTTDGAMEMPRRRSTAGLSRVVLGIILMICGMGMFEMVTDVSTLKVRSLMMVSNSEYYSPLNNVTMTTSSVTVNSDDPIPIHTTIEDTMKDIIATAAIDNVEYEHNNNNNMNETEASEIDYDAFWKQAIQISFTTSSSIPAFNLTKEFSCPKVYLYDNLPGKLVDTAKNSGLGRKQKLNGSDGKKYKGLLYLTNQYSFPSILKSRLKRYPCRTTDPNEADLFFAPILTAPKLQRQWRSACSKVNGTDVKEALTFLNSTNACRHFFAMGKGHYNGNRCTEWWKNPVPELVPTQRIAYSERGFKNDSSGRHFYRPGDNTTNEYPNLHSVPYPTSVHFHPSRPASGMPQFQNMTDRRSLMSFIGGDYHGDVPVRRLIHHQCNSYNDTSICDYKKTFRNKLLTMKGKSIFCLEPAGDSPWRKSIADSIVFGCIPVLFSNLTDDATPWFWEEWKSRGRVLVDRDDFLAGRVDLQRLLESTPPSFLEAMQSTLRERSRQFQYSVDTDTEDGISLLLERLYREADKMEQDGDCGYSTSTS